MTRPLLLIDAASQYFRAFHGMPESVTSPDGVPVNAVRGFLDILGRQLVSRRPARVVACFDLDWRPAFRVAAVPGYKAHRVGPDGGEVVPDALRAQVPVIEEVLEALGIAQAGASGYEADDVIATLTAREAAATPVEVLTGDRDLFQLIDDDAGIVVLYTGRSGVDVVTDDVVVSRYGIPARSYAQFALLRGDPSDGLPGVAGIGERTAASLLTRFGDLGGVLGALQSGTLPAAQARRLTEGLDYLRTALPVVLCARDVPVPALADELPAVPAHPELLAALKERWGLGSSVDRVVAAMASTRRATPRA